MNINTILNKINKAEFFTHLNAALPMGCSMSKQTFRDICETKAIRTPDSIDSVNDEVVLVSGLGPVYKLDKTLPLLDWDEVLGLEINPKAIREHGEENVLLRVFCAKHKGDVEAREETRRTNRRIYDRSDPNNRLLPIFNALGQLGYNTDISIAQEIGIAPQVISYMRCRDDTQVGKIKKIFNGLGYNIDFSFGNKQSKNRRPERTVVSSHVEVTIDVSDGLAPKRKRITDLLRLRSKSGLTGFIADEVLESRMKITRFCAKYDISYTRLFNVIRADECSFSFACEIAEKLGKKLHIHISR